MLAALCVAITMTAPATLTERPSAPILTETLASPSTTASQQLLQADPNAPDHEPSFVEKYLSFQVANTGSKQVKDGLILGHVLGYLFYGVCGTLWGPVVATKDAEFTGDVAITWFLSSLLWGLISGFTGIGAVLIFALPYLGATAVFNELDRGIKKKGLAPVDKPPPTPGTPTPGTPPQPGETPPPSYAY